MLKLAGKLEAIGRLLPDDATDASNDGAVLRLHDGRQIIIRGLTQEECRKLAPELGEPYTVRGEGLPC